ncbi:MAG: glutathione S-transferase C-terminal domain-containing protein, partial [Gammaproteobacteria bacterium]
MERQEWKRLALHRVQLTIADLVAEIHDVHHPIAGSLYYHQQKREARRRAGHFTMERVPKFLDYFERVVAANPKGRGYMLGRAVSYV